MLYVPKDWIKNKKNESIVHEILNKYLNSDINTDIASAIRELENIGETRVVEKIMDGTLTVD